LLPDRAAAAPPRSEHGRFIELRQLRQWLRDARAVVDDPSCRRASLQRTLDQLENLVDGHSTPVFVFAAKVAAGARIDHASEAALL
jgi:hypothetical protein